MKISLSLLKKFIPLENSAQEIADSLTLLGLEVDSIEYVGQNLNEIIPVEIQSIEKHPSKETLQILSVSSNKKKYTVVCADLTVKKGQISALAPIGATIHPFKESAIKITKRSFGPIQSNAVLCSEKDLGISSNHAAVLSLDKQDLKLNSIQSLYEDVIFDVSLTPNLGHCRSILGTARELSAHYNLKLNTPTIPLVENEHARASDCLKVTNNYTQGCLQYHARVLKNVAVTESSRALKRSVELLGYKSVNNVVDCLNYTMHLLGQPLHGFDLDQLEGNELRIEKAKGKEILSALDHKDYTLNEDAIVIYDKVKPVCIAGIIGDEKTSIKNTSTNIAIEAAQFNPQAIRKTTKFIGLRTDSSNRFENQIDPLGVEKALDAACSLITSECTGSICQASVSGSCTPYQPRVVPLRLAKIQSVLGIKVSISEVQTFLERLSMPPKLENETFLVPIASFRNDIHSEIDLVEEILRLYGYNNIKKIDLHCTLSNQEHSKVYTFKRVLSDLLQKLGLQEFVTCNLISDKEGKLESQDLNKNQELIKVLHAKSQDQSILRPSLFTGFLNAIRINQRQKNRNIRAFELGHTYLKNNGKLQEDLTLAIIFTGLKNSPHFENKGEPCNFFTLKGILEKLFSTLEMSEISYTTGKSLLFHPHQQAQILYKSTPIGVFGSVHPTMLDSYDCGAPVFFADLNTASIFNALQKTKRFTSLSIFPSSTRDLTITVLKTIKFSNLKQKILKLSCPILKEIELLDIFQQDKESQTHNVTFRFTYRNELKTLLDQEVQEAHNQITLALQSD